VRHRQNGEFEAQVVDFNQLSELNFIPAVAGHYKTKSPAAASGV